MRVVFGHAVGGNADEPCLFERLDVRRAAVSHAGGDAADELAVLVAALEPPDREIFLRKYYLMQSSREIAAALDLRVSTVNTRLSRGRDRLRRQLQERGYTHG